MFLPRLAVVVASIALTAACSLTTDLDALRGDGGVEAGAPCDAIGACAKAKVPSGWTPIAYHEGFVGCPAGYTATAYVTKPTGGCTCSCTMSAIPRCDVGTVNTFFGANAQCGSAGASIPATAGACSAVTGALAAYFKANPLTPTGGACNPLSIAVPATTTRAEACVRDECGDTVCKGIVPQGYKACIITAGVAPCPAGTPFTISTTVGTLASATCAPGCTCSVKSSCANPTVDFFKDTNCTNFATTLPADGTCVSTGAQSGATIGGMKYHATAVADCAAAGTSTATFSYVEPHTVCCAP